MGPPVITWSALPLTDESVGEYRPLPSSSR